MNDYAVTLENVTFAYEKKPVLNNLSLSVPNNKVCFIMGNNGSGKSTLLKTIMGFLPPQSGTVIIKGKNASNIDRQTASKLISYVPQAIHLNTDFTVIDYLSLGRTPHIGLIAQLKDSDYEIVDKYSKRLGIDDIFSSPFNKLSGGQKQTVAIARSLIQDTPLIIMDEPMSALDLGKQVECLQLLYELSEHKTIIITTHNPNHALTIESDSCFLASGEIVSYGESKSIICDSLLHKVYGDKITLDHGNKNDTVIFDISNNSNNTIA